MFSRQLLDISVGSESLSPSQWGQFPARAELEKKSENKSRKNKKSKPTEPLSFKNSHNWFISGKYCNHWYLFPSWSLSFFLFKPVFLLTSSRQRQNLGAVTFSVSSLKALLQLPRSVCLFAGIPASVQEACRHVQRWPAQGHFREHRGYLPLPDGLREGSGEAVQHRGAPPLWNWTVLFRTCKWNMRRSLLYHAMLQITSRRSMSSNLTVYLRLCGNHGLDDTFEAWFSFDSVLYSKMDFGSTQSIATTTWTPVWSWANWWGTAGTSTSSRPVACSSRWSTSPSTASCSPPSRKSANTRCSWQSCWNTLHRSTGSARTLARRVASLQIC